jgi:hypothetical protein
LHGRLGAENFEKYISNMISAKKKKLEEASAKVEPSIYDESKRVKKKQPSAKQEVICEDPEEVTMPAKKKPTLGSQKKPVEKEEAK